MNNKRKWSGRWIAAPAEIKNAPEFRTDFKVDDLPECAVLYLCTPNYFIIKINGKTIGNDCLSPAPSQFDQRLYFMTYDIKPFIRSGKNFISITLGNGWFSCHDRKHWNYHNAPWYNTPRLICDLELDNQSCLASNNRWQVFNSPITFNGVQAGEFYDARQEISDYDAAPYELAQDAVPPGGIIEDADFTPCRITQFYPGKLLKIFPFGQYIYDFGTNLAGCCRITFEAPCGTELFIQHGEMLKDNCDLDLSYIDMHAHGEVFQEDRYIAKGGGVEVWQPSFTYHGFRYVKIRLETPLAKIHKIEALFIHNDFNSIGKFDSSNPILNRLQAITRQSFLSNFVGIPTDCPHREKNGWTGDVALAMETGLWNFDCANDYFHFIQCLIDCQRPDGQFPCIAPSPNWGYNWGAGPVWDSLLFIAAKNLWLFANDDRIIRKFYDNMKRYLEYCASRSENYLVNFGLGDWCPVEIFRMTAIKLSASACYFNDVTLMAEFAAYLGKSDDEKFYSDLAGKIKAAFNAEYPGKDESWTALATPVYFNLVDDTEKTKLLNALATKIRANSHKVDFGILGAKYIPRILAENGFADDALKLLTQTEYPGWGYWISQGATTLWETWSGQHSRNHIMYGDVSAWMFNYAGGITPLEPGFRRFTVAPKLLNKIAELEVEYKSFSGLIKVKWRHDGGKLIFDLEIPHGCTAEIELLHRQEKLPEGNWHFEI